MDLADELPSFLFRTPPRTRTMAQEGTTTQSASGFSGLKLDEKKLAGLSMPSSLELKIKPPPLPLAWERNTSFTCHRSAEVIFDALSGALKEFGVQASEATFKCKSTTYEGQLLSFCVSIFADSTGSYLVEFQRHKGDPVAFWHLYEDVMDKLAADLAEAAAWVKMSAPYRKKRQRVDYKKWVIV